MPAADADQTTHLRLLLHHQPVHPLELPRDPLNVRLVLLGKGLPLSAGRKLIGEVDFEQGVRCLELEGVSVVLEVMGDVENAQPLLLIATY